MYLKEKEITGATLMNPEKIKPGTFWGLTFLSIHFGYHSTPQNITSPQHLLTLV